MNGVLALVAMTVVSIDYGWQPLEDGGFEYIIQIEPHMVGSLEGGQPIASQLPRNLRGMRSYRIIVGDAKLPHQGEPFPVEPVPPAHETPPLPAGNVTAPMTPANPEGNQPSTAGAAAAENSAGAAPPRSPASGTSARAMPGPDLAAPSIEVRPASVAGSSADTINVASESTPPPALEPEPSSTTIAPRMAGYLESPATSHAGRSETGTRAAGGLAFPGTGTSSARAAAADPASSATPSPLNQNDGHVSANPSGPADIKSGSSLAGHEDVTANPGQPAVATTSAKATPPGDTPKEPSESKPWLPLAGAVVALFASLGANIFLGWNTLTLRSRYRSLVAQLHAG